jgi:uracil-DNA glycosylase family 4
MIIDSLNTLQDQIIQCGRCPRLVAHREQIGVVKRREYESWTYWSRPVPSFGDLNATVLAIGLAPAAHGGNRTGRMFTGDASARFLMDALWELNFSNQPTSHHIEDGLHLYGIYLTASLRCAPPSDKPTRAELLNCAPYLEQELLLLPRLRVVLALGKIAFESYLKIISRQLNTHIKLPFKHGARYPMPIGPPLLYSSYHPSPRNHQTGRLTRASFIEILMNIRRDGGLA